MKDSTISSRGELPGQNLTFSYKRVPSVQVLFVKSYKPVFFFGKPIDSTGKLCYNIYIKATRTPQTS